MAAAVAVSDRDWASLPPLLLCLTAERLTPAAYARLRGVCASWSSAVSPEDWEEGQRQPYYLPRSLWCPWLMLPSEHDDGPHTFLSLPESLQPYRIPAPAVLHGKRIYGSHAGWLATIDAECDMLLTNPLTGADIPLPHISTHPDVGVVRDPFSGRPVEFLVTNIQIWPPEDFRDIYIKKILLSASPSSPPAYYVVVLISGLHGWLAYARAGGTAWSVLGANCLDAVFVGRKLYAVADDGEIVAIDFSEAKPRPNMVAERTSDYRMGGVPRYLVFSSGYLFQLTRVYDDDGVVFKTLRFIVERVDLMGGGINKRHRMPIYFHRLEPVLVCLHTRAARSETELRLLHRRLLGIIR